jgi:hypothetical protein
MHSCCLKSQVGPAAANIKNKEGKQREGASADYAPLPITFLTTPYNKSRKFRLSLQPVRLCLQLRRELLRIFLCFLPRVDIEVEEVLMKRGYVFPDGIEAAELL